MKFALLLALLLVRRSHGEPVNVHAGQNVNLTCTYDSEANGLLHTCWGKGQLPNYGCGDQLIGTSGPAVIEKSRTSSRYQLLGRLDQGDVSLTIINVTESDTGVYGCRIEIPGPFNDDKHHFELNVLPAVKTTTAAAGQTSAAPTTTGPKGQLTTFGVVATSFSSNVRTERRQGNSVVTVIVVCALVMLITLGTACGLFIIARRSKNLSKTPQLPLPPPLVGFSPTSSTLELNIRSPVVENIYQIDDGGDGDRGEYENCP